MYVQTILLGILVGLALGALGGGGSTLAVPVLVFGAGMSAYDASGAALMVVGSAAAIGAVGHFRRGHVKLGTGATFAAAGLGGSFLGTQIGRNLPEPWLLGAFALLIVFVASRMLRPSSAATAASTDLSETDLSETGLGATSMLRMFALASAVGTLTGVFGVGGGFVIVPALVMGLGFDTKDAVGTSLVVVALNSGIALLLRGSSLNLDWGLVLPFLAMVITGTLLGGYVGHRTDSSQLKTAFAYLLMGIAALTAARSLGFA